MKVTQDASDRDRNKYTGYEISFDSGSEFSEGKNVIIFDCDMSFSVHERNSANNIYVLGKDFIQGVTTIEPTSVGCLKDKRTPIYKGGI